MNDRSGPKAAPETTAKSSTAIVSQPIRVRALTGCPCGCMSSRWTNDPKCIRHSTPGERYRRLRGVA